MQSSDLLHFVNCLLFVTESYLLSVSGGVFSIPDKSPISWFIPWACLTRNIFCGEIPLADTIFNGVRVCKHRNNTKCSSHISVWHYPVTCLFPLKSYWHYPVTCVFTLKSYWHPVTCVHFKELLTLSCDLCVHFKELLTLSCNLCVHFKELLTFLSGFMGCAKWKQCLSKCVQVSKIQSDCGLGHFQLFTLCNI